MKRIYQLTSLLATTLDLKQLQFSSKRPELIHLEDLFEEKKTLTKQARENLKLFQFLEILQEISEEFLGSFLLTSLSEVARLH